MNVAVYLGSSLGNRDIYKTSVKELGRKIALNGHTLVFGGSSAGLMGELASSCKESRGYIVGIELRLFSEMDLDYKDCDEFILTDSFSERRNLMIQKSDAFIAFPGGSGTLDEISEVIVIDRFSNKRRPIVFLNIQGYYEPLKSMFMKMVEEGFLDKEEFELIKFVDNVDDAISLLK